MMAASNWAQLYAESLVDVSDIADEVGKTQGGFFQTARDIDNNGQRWIAMPFTILGVLFANRTSWFSEVGVGPEKFPETWD
jgi:multiple sugar transport system substrate-binding protein